MMNPKEAPLYKGFFKIFFFFLLAMVGGFLGGELRALKADALTSSVAPPAPPHKGDSRTPPFLSLFHLGGLTSPRPPHAVVS